MKNAQLSKQEDYRKKLSRTTMVLRTKTKDRLDGMRTTSDRIKHMAAETTKTNTPEMIAEDHPHEIAPTPRHAARAAQVITTETEHHSLKKIRNTKLQ
jgi:hypothetical protein